MKTKTTTSDLERYLALLAGREPAGGLLELRYRDPSTPARMRQQFHDAADTRKLALEILRLGSLSDVYISVAPRRIRNGGRRAVARAWVLWADVDLPDGDGLASRLPLAPGVVINTGSPGHRHLYWPLTESLAPAELERANQTLAAALGADTGAVLGVATILRPPHTRNHKHTPPRPVTLERFNLCAHSATEILAGLPAPQPPRTPAAGRQRESASDPLLNIAPADYVEALTGQSVPRDRKISCPLHEDRTPSLHVYADATLGWHCYGCNQGGTIYDLAAKLWLSGRSANALRGRQFVEVRQRLQEMFFSDDVTTQRSPLMPRASGR
jgi:hypothetical protein